MPCFMMSVCVSQIARRSFILFGLGLMVSNGSSPPWSEVRIMGVLQRFAVSYCVTALLLTHTLYT